MFLRHGSEKPVVASGALHDGRYERDPAVPRRRTSGFEDQNFVFGFGEFGGHYTARSAGTNFSNVELMEHFGKKRFDSTCFTYYVIVNIVWFGNEFLCRTFVYVNRSNQAGKRGDSHPPH